MIIRIHIDIGDIGISILPNNNFTDQLNVVGNRMLFKLINYCQIQLYITPYRLCGFCGGKCLESNYYDDKIETCIVCHDVGLQPFSWPIFHEDGGVYIDYIGYYYFGLQEYLD